MRTPAGIIQIPMKNKAINIALAFLFILLAPVRPVKAETSVSYREVLEKTAEINKNLETFKARLNMKVLYAGMTIPLKGILYYQAPSRFRLKVPYLPPGLKSRQGSFNEMVPRSFNPEDYLGKIVKNEMLDDKVNCYVLELAPRNDKNTTISRAYLWIDSKSYISPKSRILYKSGGVITTVVNYRDQSGFILPSSQYVEFDFPSFCSRVKIKYADYQVNCPLEEHVFAR